MPCKQTLSFIFTVIDNKLCSFIFHYIPKSKSKHDLPDCTDQCYKIQITFAH